MSTIVGSLSTAMRDYTAQGQRLAVLVIDEQSTVPQPFLTAQEDVLRTASALQLPTWLVELNPNLHKPDRYRANRATNLNLSRLVPNAQVLTKPHINAFASNAAPNLHAALTQINVGMLVIMGYKVDCCVQATAIGAFDGKNMIEGTFRPGATQLGYVVLTSPTIVRPTAPEWKNAEGVRVYTSA